MLKDLELMFGELFIYLGGNYHIKKLPRQNLKHVQILNGEVFR